MHLAVMDELLTLCVGQIGEQIQKGQLWLLIAAVHPPCHASCYPRRHVLSVTQRALHFWHEWLLAAPNP